MEFREVHFPDVCHQLAPMFEEHYKEIARYKDIPLKLNIDKYSHIAGSGGFKFYVAYQDNLIQGYAGFFVSPHMHYDDSLQANQDVIYIDKKLRKTGIGSKFIEYCDDELKKLGVQVVYHHSKVAADFGPTLKNLGYEHVENIYGKRLDQ